MRKIISIEKVSNGFIVTNGNTKRVYDGSPLKFELDQIHQMLYNSKEGDSHTIVIEVDPPVFTSQDHDSIELCGLLWDKENISVGGIEKDCHYYFTWAEAMEAAEKQGKRLPTADEWKALCDLGSTWDDKLNGRWFGGNHNTDHKGSIFLPACGLHDKVGVYASHLGFYWSSSSGAGDSSQASNLFFHIDDLCVDYSDVGYCFPLRLVRDIVK
ncbi:hypothetical protein [Alistipes indistinctus]|uniref:hypothetical protein n=1 Tax=Alistipes indistinctus TaxID=626932 RepID=UPI0024317782|nr:hypothetical protein [Alistipes indistinctus]